MLSTSLPLWGQVHPWKHVGVHVFAVLIVHGYIVFLYHHHHYWRHWGARVSGFCRIISSGLWSLLMYSYQPNVYWFKCSKVKTIASISFYIWAYRVSVAVKEWLTCSIGLPFWSIAVPRPLWLAPHCMVRFFERSLKHRTGALVTSHCTFAIAWSCSEESVPWSILLSQATNRFHEFRQFWKELG